MYFRKSLITLVIVFCVLLFAPKLAQALTSSNEPLATSSEVVVVYNSNYSVDGDVDGFQDSLQIANYYKQARNIPENNLIGLSATSSEIISRSVYNSEIKTPLETELLNRGLASSTKYIVLIKGMPLKIKDSNPAVTDFGVYGQADYSSVDSAVTLLFENFSNVWAINNPYYGDPGYSTAYRFKNGFYSGGGVKLNYLVTRLDGYTVGDVLTMIDNALLAPSSGGDVFLLDDITSISCDNMSYAHSKLKTLNTNLIPSIWESTNSIVTTTLPTVAYTSYGRHSALGANYYGTYLHDMDWSPGAVSATFESYNGYSFDITKRLATDHGQVADFIESGGSGGIGNVYEPWCSAVAKETIWMPAYKIGYTWADSAYLSLQYLDFVSVVVGDPLMRIYDENNLPPYETNGTVQSMIYNQPNNKLYIGGDFTRVSNSDRSYFAEINPATGLPSERNFMVNGPVYSMLIEGDVLYLGGSFTSVLGQSRSNFAAINLTTGELTSLNISSNGLIRTMVIKDSVLYIGGDFTTINSQSKNYLAAVNVSTGQLVNFNFSANGAVKSLALNQNILYVGGSFVTINSLSRNLLAAIDISSNILLPFSFNIVGGDVNSLVYDQDKLFVGGAFTAINSQNYKYLAVINTLTNRLILKDFAVNGSVVGIKTMVKKNGQLYVGGSFNTILGQTRVNLASFSIGSYELSPVSYQINGPVSSFSLSSNEHFIGGSFTIVDSINKFNIYASDYFSSFFEQTNVVAQNIQTIHIPVNISRSLATDFTVAYTASGSAIYGTDYQIEGGQSGTVVIPAGQTSSNINVQILRNPTSRTNLVLTLSQPSTGTIFSSQYTVTLVGDSFDILLSKANLSIYKSSTPETYTLALTQQPTESVSVSVSVRNTNYASSTPASLIFTSDNWNQGQSISVQVKNVTLPQSQLSTYIDYSFASDDVFYNDLQVTSTPVAIYDEPIINFSSSSGVLSENQTINAVVLTNQSYNSDIAISYSVTSPATYGSEYMVVGGQQGSLILPAGQTSVSLPISVLNMNSNQITILTNLSQSNYGSLGTSTSFIIVATKASNNTSGGGGGSSSGGGGGGGGGSSASSVPTANLTTPVTTINSSVNSNIVTPNTVNNLTVSIAKVEFNGKQVTFVNPNKADDVISHLNVKKDEVAETKAKTQIESDAKEFKVLLADNESQKAGLFVAYGIDDVSKALGSGERRAVIRDYLETTKFSQINWDDVVRLSQGVKPVKRNIDVEREQVKIALPAFKKIFGVNPDFKNNKHDLAWNVLLYRIRFQRNLESEKKGIISFKQTYKRNPSSPFDWSIVRASGYVK